MSEFEERAEVVIDLFRDLLDCAGRRFGSLSLGLLGISDGQDGVQWNAWYSRSEQTAWLGVNLEGKKYDDWPVARLIERELSHPLLLTEYRARVAKPERVTVSWWRDAWQVSSRVPIKESRLSPTPIALGRLDAGGWKRALQSARECLDPKRGYRGRRRTRVTLRRSGQMVERHVTPHLQFKMLLAETAPDEMLRAKGNLEALHDWASCQARPREDASSAPLDSISTMLGRLNTFYESHGISPVGFRCPSHMACSADSPDFTTAKASFVGPAYEEGHLPRLVFLSLDSGSADPDPRRRTAEAVRRQELARDVASLPGNRHWYRTHELAFELLRQFKEDLTIDDARLYFAHVNSAKCCQNKPGRRQADNTLFRSCRRFIPGELRVLRPDIVVTQGGPAKAAILGSFDVRCHFVRTTPVSGYKRDAHYETGIIEIEPRKKEALWVQTYHPNNFGHFNPQRAHCWPLYAKAVREFWRDRRR